MAEPPKPPPSPLDPQKVREIISKIRASFPSPEAKQSTQQEEKYLEGELQKEQLNTLKQNNAERKKYAKNIFWFTIGWAIAIIIVVIFSGWDNCYFHLKFSDAVLITLITTTTVNFFGFFLLVIKYLFNPDKST